MPQDIIDGLVSVDLIARVTQEKAALLPRHRVVVGDIILSRRGDLTRAASISKREEGWLCGTGCFLLRMPSKFVNANWLAEVYRCFGVQRQIGQRIVGSTMPSLNNAVIESLLISWPEIDEQNRVIETLKMKDRQIAGESDILAKLCKLKSGLMSDLLTGRVRVPETIKLEAV